MIYYRFKRNIKAHLKTIKGALFVPENVESKMFVFYLRTRLHVHLFFKCYSRLLFNLKWYLLVLTYS